MPDISATLHLTPQQAGYAVTLPHRGLRAQFDNGPGRYGKDVAGMPVVFNVLWLLDADAYDYFWAFYRLNTNRGALLFNISLIAETADLASYTVRFIPGTLQVSSVVAPFFEVQAQLEATALH